MAFYRDSASAVSIDLRNGTGLGGDAEGDVLIGINAVTGSVHDDVLIGNDAANVLDGGAGTNTIMGGGGADRIRIAGTPTLVDGGAGRDMLLLDGGTVVLTDTNFRNVETIRIADDVILDLTGLAAQPIVDVDTQNQNSNVTIIGRDTDDVVTQISGKFQFDGNEGDDILYAQDYARFDGGDGFDTLFVSGASSLRVGVEHVERIVFDQFVNADFAVNYGTGILGLTIEAPGGNIMGDGGNDTIIMGDLGGTVGGGYGDDRIELGSGAEVVRITDRRFGHDTVVGFDVTKDSLNFQDSRVDGDSVYFQWAAGGTKLVYTTYIFDQQVSNSIMFVGVDYNTAVTQIDMVF